LFKRIKRARAKKASYKRRNWRLTQSTKRDKIVLISQLKNKLNFEFFFFSSSLSLFLIATIRALRIKLIRVIVALILYSLKQERM